MFNMLHYTLYIPTRQSKPALPQEEDIPSLQPDTGLLTDSQTDPFI